LRRRQTSFYTEEGIRAHLQINEIRQAITKSFFIRICGNELVVDLKPSIDQRQLRLRLERIGNP